MRLTTYICDWSTDVCSSDLGEPDTLIVGAPESAGVPSPQSTAKANFSLVSPPTFSGLSNPGSVNWPMLVIDKIGRASCRGWGGTVSVGETFSNVTAKVLLAD